MQPTILNSSVMSGPRRLHLIPPSGDLLTKVLLVRFQSPNSLHSRLERHLPMPDWRDESTALRSASRAKSCRQQISQEEVGYEIHLGEREKSPSRQFVLVVL